MGSFATPTRPDPVSPVTPTIAIWEEVGQEANKAEKEQMSKRSPDWWVILLLIALFAITSFVGESPQRAF